MKKKKLTKTTTYVVSVQHEYAERPSDPSEKGFEILFVTEDLGHAEAYVEKAERVLQMAQNRYQDKFVTKAAELEKRLEFIRKFSTKVSTTQRNMLLLEQSEQATANALTKELNKFIEQESQVLHKEYSNTSGYKTWQRIKSMENFEISEVPLFGEWNF
jgi:GDP-D-mannose dehydratase